MTIYDFYKGNKILISNITGIDMGPYSYGYPFHFSNWKKKVISSSSNKMMVKFQSDDFGEYGGFSATITYSSIQNNACETSLDMNRMIIQSPNYPNPYSNNLTCNWIITAEQGFHITLEFLIFEVSFNYLIMDWRFDIEKLIRL